MTQKLTPEIRHQVIEKTTKLIIENYAFPDTSDRMANYILEKLAAGSYDDCYTNQPGDLFRCIKPTTFTIQFSGRSARSVARVAECLA